jgi:hypothetical protein
MVLLNHCDSCVSPDKEIARSFLMFCRSSAKLSAQTIRCNDLSELCQRQVFAINVLYRLFYQLYDSVKSVLNAVVNRSIRRGYFLRVKQENSIGQVPGRSPQHRPDRLKHPIKHLGNVLLVAASVVVIYSRFHVYIIHCI